MFLIRTLVSAQPWAREMVDQRWAIAVDRVGDIAQRVVEADRLKEVSEGLHLRPSML